MRDMAHAPNGLDGEVRGPGLLEAGDRVLEVNRSGLVVVLSEKKMNAS